MVNKGLADRKLQLANMNSLLQTRLSCVQENRQSRPFNHFRRREERSGHLPGCSPSQADQLRIIPYVFKNTKQGKKDY